MNAKQARQLCEQASAPLPPGIEAMSTEKVRNTRRKTVEGREFRSTLEAKVYQLLRSWERAGAIRNLVCQPKYVLQPTMRIEGRAVRAITYIADFQFEQPVPIREAVLEGAPRRWQTVVVDAKGYRMGVYRIKAKLLQARFPHVIFQEWDKDRLKREGG